MAERGARTRATNKGRANRGPPPVQPRDPNDPANFGVILENATHRARWDVLASYQCKPSRYSDDQCTQAMGIHDDVWRLFERVGIATAMGGRWPTHRRMMLEFLSTLKIVKQKETPKIHMIEFQLDNRALQLTMEELNGIYGSSTHGIYLEPAEFYRNRFWNLITNAEGPQHNTKFDGRTNKVSPVFRYILKVLANSTFARKESGSVTMGELFMIWCGLQGLPFDLASHVAEHMVQASKKRGGTLMVGGFITPIADYFQIDYSD